ncbi:hypothetical protein PH30N_00005, partial [Cutibacterium modestum 30N]|nr:hypothetical protein [Cutibacterium modestum 30N]
RSCPAGTHPVRSASTRWHSLGSYEAPGVQSPLPPKLDPRTGRPATPQTRLSFTSPPTDHLIANSNTIVGNKLTHLALLI